MNKVILIGRLTKDPELRYTTNGAAVATFNIAVDRPKSQNQQDPGADFIDIVVWNKLAENVAKYITKGRQVAVEGRLQIRSYEANDGQRRWRTEVIANHVEFLGNSSNAGNSQGGQGNYPPQQQQQGGQGNYSPQQQQGGQGNYPPQQQQGGNQQQVSQNDFSFGNEITFTDEDLPF